MAGAKRKAGSGNKRAVARSGRAFGWRARLAAFALLLVLAGGAYAWWYGQNWRPDEGQWPDQGALVSASDGAVDFTTIKGLGAKLVYLEASVGAGRQDSRFSANLAAARAARLQVGALHRFDPCVPADGQSANFVTMVPRDDDLLPPVIALDALASDCPERIHDAAVQSELMTLVNQIEAHVGKPVILAPTARFEDAYGIAHRLDRQLWLTRSWSEPEYAGRPWLIWTANEHYRTEAADDPLRWFVVRG